MPNEILFKGKRISSPNEWIIGDVNHIQGKVFIFPRTEDFPLNSPDWFEVIPETICQFIGLEDKNGKKVFENDKMKGDFGTGSGGKSTRYKQFLFNIEHSSNGFSSEFRIKTPNNLGNYRFFPYIKNCEIIGNVHD